MKDFKFKHLGYDVFVKFLTPEEIRTPEGSIPAGLASVQREYEKTFGIMKINKEIAKEMGKKEILKTFFHELVHITIQFKHIDIAFCYPHELEESFVYAAEDCLSCILDN